MSVDLANHPSALYPGENADSIVKSLSLFSALNDISCKQLLDDAEQKMFPTQTLIIREGDYETTMYIILDGWVDVFATSDDGYETNLSALTQGHYFGEQALLPHHNGYRTASVRASTDVITLIINKPSVR